MSRDDWRRRAAVVRELALDAGELSARQMIALHPMIKRLRPPAHDWNDVLASRQ